MDTQSTAPADGNLRGAAYFNIEVSNGTAGIVQRGYGPRHIAPIIAKILWKLAVKREAERAKVRP
jgi:hypothetical protein